MPLLKTEKPVGQVTRGFTAPNRLRLVDTYALVALREHLRTMPGMFVDLGYGARPLTTLESFERFRRVAPGLQALGVEIEPERVEAARPFSREGLAFRRGGFNLPLDPDERVSLVRAFNVLRQYDEAEVAAAMAELATWLAPGAVVLEGTSDPWGRHVCFWVWEAAGPHPPARSRDFASLAGEAESSMRQRRDGAVRLVRKWLVFGARDTPEFSPRELQPFLPKEVIHRAEPGGRVDAFFARWERAWASSAGAPRKRRWEASIRRLAADVALDMFPGLWRRRLVAVRPEAVGLEAWGESANLRDATYRR